MTSASFMQTRITCTLQRSRMLTLLAAAAFPAMLTLISGCAPRLVEPAFLESPYPRTQTWAVAPFINESGASHVDGFRIADLFAQQAQDVRGITVIPVNRVHLAMRELDIDQITSPSDARLLMGSLGLDGLIIGTVTAYDPYRPMALGAAIELHIAERARPQAGDRPIFDLDTWTLVRSPREIPFPTAFAPLASNPIAQAAGIFDTTNHRTLALLEAYATGRTPPESAYGQDIYLVSMDMYTQFVAFRLLHDLLETERLRLFPQEEEPGPLRPVR